MAQEIWRESAPSLNRLNIAETTAGIPVFIGDEGIAALVVLPGLRKEPVELERRCRLLFLPSWSDSPSFSSNISLFSSFVNRCVQSCSSAMYFHYHVVSRTSHEIEGFELALHRLVL